MRILLLSQFFQPEPMFKGLPFAHALQRLGHKVEVVTGIPNYPGGRVYPGYRVRPPFREVLESVPVTRLPLYPSHSDSTVGRVANYLSFGTSAALYAPWLEFRPDVVYVYNLITLGFASRILRSLHECAVVLDVQDIWPESVLNSGLLKKRWLERLLARWCRFEYGCADRITVLSPGFKRKLIARGVSAGRIEVVYNWCEEIRPDLSPAETEQLWAESGFRGRFNILFAGTMGRLQALDVVIAAARLVADRAPEVLFTFVGGGVEVGRLKALAAGKPNVQFLPRRPGREAIALAQAADALLVHLRDDPVFSITIPSKTQAYLYAGKPILMGVRGDAADLIDQAGAGISFAPDNPTAMAEAVLQMARFTVSERTQMGRNGRTFYIDRLSLARGVGHFERVFRDAVRDRLGVSSRQGNH